MLHIYKLLIAICNLMYGICHSSKACCRASHYRNNSSQYLHCVFIELARGWKLFCSKWIKNSYFSKTYNQTKFVKTKRPKVILVVSIDLFCSQIVNFSTMETIMFVKKLTMETQCYNSLNYFGSYTTLIHYELLGAKLGFSF